MNPAHWNRCKQGLHTHIQYVHTHTKLKSTKKSSEKTALQMFMDTYRIIFCYRAATNDYFLSNNMLTYFYINFNLYDVKIKK